MIKVGSIKRIKVDQDFTCEEARGKMCVIETMEPDGDFSIRIQRNDGTHLHQRVYKYHLEDV